MVENDRVVIESAAIDQVINSNQSKEGEESKPNNPISNNRTSLDKGNTNTDPMATPSTSTKSNIEFKKSNSSSVSASERGRTMTSNESTDSPGASIEDDADEFLYHSDFSI